MLTALLVVLGALCVVGGIMVMLLNSGTLFFAVWYVLGALLLGAAWLTHADVWAKLPPAVLRGGAVLLGAVALAMAAALGAIFTEFGATGTPDLDYIVVLGAQIYDNGSPSPSLKYRLDAAVNYLRENPRTICIVSGGKGPNEPYPEAQGMASYLRKHGVESERIIEEPRSTTTRENVENAKALMDSHTSSVGIVTNNFHVYRAVRTARKAGLANACGIAGYSTPLYLPNNLLRECLALIKDVATGNV